MPQDNTKLAALFFEQRLARIRARDRDKEIVAIYTGLRTYESDCDKAQGTLRTIASAWLLAAIGGIGLIIQSEYADKSRLDEFVAAPMRQGLLFLASAGLVSLWYVDQGVYQRLLHGSFAAGCWMEEKYTSLLPPIRMYIYKLNLNIKSYLGWFYRAPILLFIMFALVNVVGAYHHSFHSGSIPNPATLSAEFSFLLSLLAFVLHIVVVLIVLIHEPRWSILGEAVPPSML